MKYIDIHGSSMRTPFLYNKHDTRQQDESFGSRKAEKRNECRFKVIGTETKE